jgi:hypothetical protein
MSNFRLEIVNQTFEVDIPNVKINYQIKDFTEVDSRKSDFSYTFDLNLSTSESFSDFLHLYCNLDYVINSEFNTFNRFIPFDSDKFSFFKENPCKLYYKGILIFNGKLEVLEGEIYERKLHKLKCRLVFGRNTWVGAATDLDIHDVDLGEYCFNLAHVTAGLIDFANVNKTTPYAFPLMEYGLLLYETDTQTDTPLTTNIEFMYPVVFVRNMLHRGFNQLGYTLEFPLLDTDEYKGLCIPTSRGSQADILNPLLGEFTIGVQNTPSTIPFSTGADNFTYYEDSTLVVDNCVELDNTNFSPPDTLGNSFPVGVELGDCLCSTGVEVCADILITVILDLGTTPAGFVATYGLNVTLNKSDGVTTTPIWTDTAAVASGNFPVAGTYTYTFLMENVCFSIGEDDTLFIETNWLSGVSTNNRTVTNVNVDAEIKVKTTEFRENYFYQLANVLPDGSFFDYVRDLITMFNLIPIEKEGKVIELVPYNDYFPSPFNSSLNKKLIDWNDKVDINGYKIKHSAIDLGRYVNLTWSEGDDFFNTEYQDENPDMVYTQYTYDTDYKPSTGESDIRVDAIPSFMYDLALKFGGNYRYPYFTDIDPNTIYFDFAPFVDREENLDVGKRYLMYRGLVTEDYNITFDNYLGGSFISPQSEYGLADFVNELSWEYLYNRFHKRELVERTKGRIVTLRVTIDAEFIANLQFCNLVYWNNNYFIVNKVQGYNPNSRNLTKVELLQIS